jgi:hypothetical protein
MWGKALIVSVCSVMLGGLLLPAGASAHVLTSRAAINQLSPYVQRVLNDRARGYVGGLKRCQAGAPHLQACIVSYDTAATRADEQAKQAAWVCPVPPRTPCGPRRPKRIAPWACVEHIQASYRAHSQLSGLPTGRF